MGKGERKKTRQKKTKERCCGSCVCITKSPFRGRFFVAIGAIQFFLRLFCDFLWGRGRERKIWMPTPTYLDSRSQLPFLQYGSLRALPQNDSKPRALPDYGWLRRAWRCRHHHPRLASLGHRGHTSCAGSGAGCVRGAQSTEGTRSM